MDKTLLEKTINSVILPRYEWINNFIVYLNIVETPTYLENYSITYYVNSGEIGSPTVIEQMEEAESLTRSSFKMLAPEFNQILYDIEFIETT